MIGKKILINGLIGTIIKEEGHLVLVKFNCGQFCFNKFSITKNIVGGEKCES